MKLSTKIKLLERRARIVRRASYWGLGIVIAFIVCELPLNGLGLFTKYEWVLPVWGGCGIAAMLTTAVLTGIYQYRYQPALTRAKSDLQATMFAQIQQQIAELSRKLDNQQ